jgi:D-alanyl-D-alanine carboxypeptidase
VLGGVLAMSPVTTEATNAGSGETAAGGARPQPLAAPEVVAAAVPSATDPTPSTEPTPTPSTLPTPTTIGTPFPTAIPTPTAVPSTGPVVLTPALSTALTKRLGELRSQLAVPGVQATIIFADGRSWRAHAGFQDYARRIPVQNQTPFPVASVTKTFIATLTVQLAQEGRFGLDDSVLTYLPRSGVDKRVTIRELLDHTSGIYDFFSNSRIDSAILGCRTCVWTPSKSLSFVKKPLFAPGTRWSYSNTNYVLLGQLIEAVTGQRYADLLRTRFFEPLGLISTFVQGQEPAPYPIVHSYRFYTSKKSEKPTSLWDGTGVGPFRSLATAAGAAGNIASSARDLALWARALYGGKVLDSVGSKAMLDVSGSLLLRSSIPYGLGVEQFTVAGRTAYGHGGRLMGARSAIRYLPSEGISIAVVINTDRGDPAAIANALATVALPPLPVVTPTPSPTLAPTLSPAPSY